MLYFLFFLYSQQASDGVLVCLFTGTGHFVKLLNVMNICSLYYLNVLIKLEILQKGLKYNIIDDSYVWLTSSLTSCMSFYDISVSFLCSI